MNISFQTKVRNEDKIIHIIEHEGYGTIHHLIEPLQVDSEQQIICTYNLTNLKMFRGNYNYIVHTTGHLFPIISNIETILKEKIKISIFLHVAPNYLIIKEKLNFIFFLKRLQDKYNLLCFCPSNEVSKEYYRYGLIVKAVQIGFVKIVQNDNIMISHNNLTCYKNKYISICTSNNPIYMHIKGIDKFVDLIEFLGKKEEALILGFNGEYRGVPCRRFMLNDFLYILSMSKLYIQLSRTEAYNMTAMQAKQLKVPIIVSDVEGHIDCMKKAVNRVKSMEEAINKVKKINYIINTINFNYLDSRDRENIESFILSLKKCIQEE